MYNITQDRFEAELRKIAASTYRWDRLISERLLSLANALHDPAERCDCPLCSERRLIERPDQAALLHARGGRPRLSQSPTGLITTSTARYPITNLRGQPQ